MPTPPLLLQGGCACRALRYEVSGIFYHRTLCHCTVCRGTTGAPAVGWFSVGSADFRWLQGQPRLYRSSAQATRGFCERCGTQLVFRQDDADEVDVTIGSLDDPQAVAPEDHTYARSALDWMERLDELPRHAEKRDAPG